MSSQFANIHQHLVDGCRQGNRQAQYEIYKLYSKAMFQVSMRILNNQTEAEDTLQEAFLDAFKKINSFKGEASFGSWLKRIVVNRSLNQLKKRKLNFNAFEPEKFQENMDWGMEASEEQEEKLARMHQAIQLLPDGFRTVLTLYIMEDYSHKEIANLLGITESTSKSQLNRAKAKLRELMVS